MTIFYNRHQALESGQIGVLIACQFSPELPCGDLPETLQTSRTTGKCVPELQLLSWLWGLWELVVCLNMACRSGFN